MVHKSGSSFTVGKHIEFTQKLSDWRALLAATKENLEEEGSSDTVLIKWKQDLSSAHQTNACTYLYFCLK